MTEALIELTDLVKTFGQSEILTGVNLVVNRGDYLSIKGRSGSGKSTLLSIIGLLDGHSAGNYSLCNQSVQLLSERQKSVLRNQHIGWVFQNFNLIGDMTVAENVALPLRYAASQRNKSQQVTEVLKQVGLADKHDAFPDQLSGGQQQRVAIARALVTNPDLILADEPTGNLDTENGTKIVELLTQLNHKGKTIIVITHDNDVAQSAKSQIEIVDGKLLNLLN